MKNKILGLKTIFWTLILFTLTSTLGINHAVAQSLKTIFFASEFNITPSTATTNQLYPDLAYNSQDDEWLVVWEHNPGGMSGTGIYGRRVDKNGNLLGNVIVFKDTTAGDSLFQPSVAYDKTQGRFLVAWVNGLDNRIEGRVIYGNGGLYPGGVRNIEDCGDLCSNPEVAYNPISDEYLVVWYSQNLLTDDTNIYGCKVGVDGTPDVSSYPIAVNPNVHDVFPALAVDTSSGDTNSGKYLLVYHSDTTGSLNIRGQRLTLNGALDGASFSITTGSGDEVYPDVAINPANHRAYVAWEDEDDPGPVSDIYGRIVFLTTTPPTLGGQTTVGNTGTRDDHPAVTFAPSHNQFLVAWDNHDTYIYGRWINGAGVPLATHFLVNDLANQIDLGDVHVAYGIDRYLTTWRYISTNSDIYGRFGSANLGLYLPLVYR